MISLRSQQKRAVFLFWFLLFSLPSFAFAAQLTLVEAGVDENGDVTIDVFAETDQKAPFNAAGADILFDPTFFTIENITTDDSIFPFWTERPAVRDGNSISFSGGTPAKGGFIFKGKLFSFTARPEAVGATVFKFRNGEILAHDGEGTDILNDTNELHYESAVIPPSFDTDDSGDISLSELSIGLVGS